MYLNSFLLSLLSPTENIPLFLLNWYEILFSSEITSRRFSPYIEVKICQIRGNQVKLRLLHTFTCEDWMQGFSRRLQARYLIISRMATCSNFNDESHGETRPKTVPRRYATSAHWRLIILTDFRFKFECPGKVQSPSWILFRMYKNWVQIEWLRTRVTIENLAGYTRSGQPVMKQSISVAAIRKSTVLPVAVRKYPEKQMSNLQIFVVCQRKWKPKRECTESVLSDLF